jgi:hypothetical protein
MTFDEGKEYKKIPPKNIDFEIVLEISIENINQIHCQIFCVNVIVLEISMCTSYPSNCSCWGMKYTWISPIQCP